MSIFPEMKKTETKGLVLEQMYNGRSIINNNQKQILSVYKNISFSANHVHGMYRTLIYLESLVIYLNQVRNMYVVLFVRQVI
jgi:hypothetical protein